jgi:hypothetical protein
MPTGKAPSAARGHRQDDDLAVESAMNAGFTGPYQVCSHPRPRGFPRVSELPAPDRLLWATALPEKSGELDASDGPAT